MKGEKEMTKAELIKEIVPATIKRWEDNTPEYSHKNKGKDLEKILWSCTKQRLQQRYDILVEKGYIK